MTERLVDSLCDTYVADVCALDPLTATSIGVAGHEHEMTDYSPAGFDAREALVHPAVEPHELQAELGSPRLTGQAPSYKVGELIWLDARAEVRARQGDDFDLKAFHRAALDLGSLGLDPLRTALERL